MMRTFKALRLGAQVTVRYLLGLMAAMSFPLIGWEIEFTH